MAIWSDGVYCRFKIRLIRYFFVPLQAVKKKGMSIANKNKATCCGCNACVEACPKHCIVMEKDSKGFLYPKVDETICVECGVCDNICPFQADKELNIPLKAYAAWNKDRDKYLSSSSGGAAYVFSSYVINQGGVVYGCASDGINIQHIRVNQIKSLNKLQGSKYVQSNVCNLFSQVKADLKNQIPVLFIGTPCQVAGLKEYIKLIPPHLYLVDLICHGVPSLQMLEEHIAGIAKEKNIESLSFRKGNNFLINIKGKSFNYTKSFRKDFYYRGFMQGITYRDCCYQCPFACPERVGDITIGDFWGLLHPEQLPTESKDGISVLLPCTDKGMRLIEQTKEFFQYFERPVEEAIKGNSQLQHPVRKTKRSWIFHTLYPIFPFDISVAASMADQGIKSLFKKAFNFK